MNREQWLTEAAIKMEAALFAPINKQMPAKWRVACSWPSSRANGKNKSGTVGQCFDPSISSDAYTEMIVTMSEDDPVEVLAILAHEMVHAVEGIAAGHGPKFRQTALAIGLTGKMTATDPGDDFKRDIKPILKALGDYPHGAVDINKNRKKQTTRMIKLECVDCGFIARASRSAIEQAGLPTCGCGGYMHDV